MSLRFLVDENFDHNTLAGLRRRTPDLDVVAVQEVGLRSASDVEILEWAAAEERIVVTHDVSTMVVLAYERVAAGKSMPGVFEIPEGTPSVARLNLVYGWRGARSRRLSWSR